MTSKNTKRALLTSALSILMCVSMLVGTTFAWFTDTASTNVNTIQAGTLDVALEVYENDEWVSAEGKTLDFVKASGHESEAILWEPGCTYSLPKLRIRNNGNLALKYKVIITGIKGDAKLNEAIEWTIDGVTMGNEYSLAVEGTKEFTISGHMKESAGNAYQGLTIDGISITVYATQDTVEYDSNHDQYDKDAKYSTADPNTTAMLITAGNLTINETLSIDSSVTNGNSDVIRVTGGDHTITGGSYTAYGTMANSALRVDGGNVTIKGGYFEAKEDNNCIYAAGGNITIEGGTFKSEKEYDGHYWVLNCKDNSGSVITLKGGRFYGFDPTDPANNTAPVGITEIVLADGYKVVNNGDWYYVIPEDATAVSSVKDLTDALIAGAKIALVGDIKLDGFINVDVEGTVDIDLNGHKIVRNDGATGIYVGNANTTLNIYGNGEVTAPNEAVYCGAGTVNIYGGTYTSLQAVYVQNTGVANIYGGTFKSEDAKYGSQYVLNQKDDSRTTSRINVYGGEFVNFNPAYNAAEGAGTNFVADGYNVVETMSGEDTIYTVVAD